MSRGMMESLELRQHPSVTSTTGRISLNSRALVPTTMHSAFDDAGRTYIASIYRSQGFISVVRVLPGGTQDISYGTFAGFAQFDVNKGGSSNREIQIAIDHAGRALLLHDGVLTRLNSKGAIDKPFGTNGTQPLKGVFASEADVAVDAKNRPIIVGTSAGKTGDRGTIARFSEKGGLDKSFGDNGTFKTPVPQDATVKIPGDATGSQVRVLSSGKIIGVVSTDYPLGDPRDGAGTRGGVSVFRLTADGDLDAKTFGSGGYTTIEGTNDEFGTEGTRVSTILPAGSFFVERSSFALSDADGPSTDTFQTSYYDTGGHVKRKLLDAVPDSISTVEGQRPTIVGRDPTSGQFIVSAAAKIYRLEGGFAYDPTFTPVPGTYTAGNIDAQGNIVIVGLKRERQVYVTVIKTA